MTVDASAVRVVLGDDRADVLEALAELVADSGFQLVGAARTGEEVIQLCRLLQPDVAVVDVEMPGGGVDGLRHLRSACPQTAVVIYSANDDAGHARKLLEAGARSYIVKGGPVEQLIEAVGEAGAG